MKKLAIVIVLAMVLCIVLTACQIKDNGLNNKAWDYSLPTVDENGNYKDGWYETLVDEFDGDSLNENIWVCSPHAIRWESQKKGNDLYNNYWCDDMVTVKDGNVEIRSVETTNHVCSKGICPSTGRFTSGIETRRIIGDPNDNKGNKDDLLFAQAFGYYEARVKIPNGSGMWSAFWLQSSNQRKVGKQGIDGTEIDIYESAFIKNPKNMGHALLWDGYGEDGRSEAYILDTGKNLYDGYHTFALKWTPTYYVFYIDGEPTYATNGGDVSQVREFLRLTIEIDAGDEWGPHGQKIGNFTNNDTVFYIDYVKVLQNKNFEKYIIEDSQFPGELDEKN